MKHIHQVKKPEPEARKCVDGVFLSISLRESSSQNVVDHGGHNRDVSQKFQTIFHLNILDWRR